VIWPATYLGWIGPLFVFFSIAYVFYLNINRAILTGVVGCTIIGFIIGGIFIIGSSINLNPSNLLYLFIGLLLIIIMCSVNVVLFEFKSRQDIEEEAVIKRIILDLGIKFTRLEVKEISEKCKVDRTTVLEVLKNMIENQEIYAEYFKTTKSVSFNQQANIDEIDKLMEAYEEWETEKIGKKG